jgi:hypothetical protein
MEQEKRLEEVRHLIEKEKKDAQTVKEELIA